MGNDPWAKQLNDINDVERVLPGILHTIREWFRLYKVPDGKPENKFGLGEAFMNKEYTMGVLAETNDAWKSLVDGKKKESKDAKDLSIERRLTMIAMARH